MRVAISVGHNPIEQGASSSGFTEYYLNSVICGHVVQHLTGLGCEAWIIGTGSLDKKIKEVNSGDFDLAVEIHSNKGGGRGAETLYYPNSVLGKKCAKIVQSKLVDKFCLKNRGAKEAWYRGKKNGTLLSWCSETNTTALIIEPGFLDNESDFEMMYTHNKELGEAIAIGIFDCLKLIEE